MVGAVEGHGLADFRGAGDDRPSRAELVVPELGQFAGELRARAVARGAVGIAGHFKSRDIGRGNQRRQRHHEPDRGDPEQRDLPHAQRRNCDQRQRHQEEQRDSPIGLHIDGEGEASERRADRDDGLDDPDV